MHLLDFYKFFFERKLNVYMRNVVFLRFICCLLLLPVLLGEAGLVFGDAKEDNRKFNDYKLSKEYIKSPEHFVHINSNCNMCMISRFANAGCVVTKDEKILLVRDIHSGKLGLPGGIKGRREVATATAVRKTLEETGLVVYIDDFISEFKNGFRLYKCKIIKDTRKKSKKITELKYVDKKELGKLLKKEKRADVRFPYELDLVYSKFGRIVK